MPLTRSFCCAVALSLTTASHAVADAYVAAMLGANQTVGTGTAATKNAAIETARQDCEQISGEDCGYYYWTRSTSYLVFMYCELDVGGEIVRGGLAHHSTSSLTRAKQLALRELQRTLFHYTYSYVTAEDCTVMTTYSPESGWSS